MSDGFSRWCRRLWRLVHVAVLLLGLAVIVGGALCFTRVPWRTYRWFSHDPYRLDRAPDAIVVLGGGGVPSESGLVRAYHGAATGHVFTNAVVIIALPADAPLTESALGKMREELILRGIPADRIQLEDRGRNTREQAMRVRDMLGTGYADQRILLTTSPDHMKRSLLTFRKLGFKHVAANAAFSESVKADVTYTSKELGGGRALAPDFGNSLRLRYLVWANANYMSVVIRESVSLTYYKLRGWV